MAIKFIIFSTIIVFVRGAIVPTTTISAKAKGLDNVPEGSDFYEEHAIVVPDPYPSFPETGFDLTMEDATVLKSDLLYLLESFVGLLRALVDKLQYLFFSNYTIFKSLAAVIFGKISLLYGLFLRGAAFLQNVFGIVSRSFVGWNFQFPAVPPSHTVYGHPTLH